METAASQQSVYALGHSEHELKRLSDQARAFAPFTRQLFEQAGIAPGMRVLDVGSGAGDSAFLAADLVGPSGEVIGADSAPAAVECANTRAQRLKLRNVRFVEADPTMLDFDRPFDAIVGRIVLMYFPYPILAIQRLARHLRHAGLMVFQEFYIDVFHSVPSAPTFERAAEWMRKTLNSTGARTQLGLELYPIFVAAGLPPPKLRIDALIAGGADFPHEIITATLQSLMPVMEKLKIATAAEVDIPTLATRMRDEVVAGKGVALSPALVGAWSRKPS
jgi:ubiquinone/menaquinone biosynthesis C-methylase UbiE